MCHFHTGICNKTEEKLEIGKPLKLANQHVIFQFVQKPKCQNVVTHAALLLGQDH